ncbi:hypothetical protein ACFPRL_04845 [Pseudoclavibacter helvolus]
MLTKVWRRLVGTAPPRLQVARTSRPASCASSSARTQIRKERLRATTTSGCSRSPLTRVQSLSSPRRETGLAVVRGLPIAPPRRSSLT